ncbi:hypothetical protein TNCV_2571031 [Trichonephila clavipes]|nr:hypothetical protein TNCV_2571031 [Trichonephila clavipes]
MSEETLSDDIAMTENELSLLMDTIRTNSNTSISEKGDFFASTDTQNSNLQTTSKETEESIASATELSKKDRETLQIFQNALADFRFKLKKSVKRCKRKQPHIPWRQSGRKWTPTSVWKPDKTPPRRRPDSSTSSSSSERPAVRGRSPVRRPPK